MEADVIVVGGGVIGLMTAWRLAQAGLTVALYEKGRPALEASAAALGLLAPRAQAGRPEVLIRLMQASLALFPKVADELRALTSIEVELQAGGLLHCALNDKELPDLEHDRQQQTQANVPVQWLSPTEALELEPSLSPYLSGALLFPTALQVDNVKLCAALTQAARRAGVKFHSGYTVTHIVQSAGRVEGIHANGETHAAGNVVVAAGSWADQIEGARSPVRPVKGQALALDSTLTLRHVLESVTGYVVPRLNGQVLVGATVEELGFDKRVTAEAIQHLLTGATRLVPALKEATFVMAWAGLRPCAKDELPILGPVERCAGLFTATGHFRNGILLAPITAQFVTAWVTGNPPELDLSAFSPNRFG